MFSQLGRAYSRFGAGGKTGIALPDAPVLTALSVSSANQVTFAMDVANTIAAGDVIAIQIQVTGGNWSSTVASANHTITTAEDTANEIDLTLGLPGTGATFDARSNVTHNSRTSNYSNTVTFTGFVTYVPTYYWLGF